VSVLVDSDILIEVTRGRDKDVLARWVDLSESDADVAYSPVSLAELWAGALPHEHAALTSLFLALTCVPIDKEIGRRAGDYLRHYKRSHAIDLGDALIAASAVVHGAMLWTRNRKHYPMKELHLV
jgi:predicted nucleic acid-binding protein